MTLPTLPAVLFCILAALTAISAVAVVLTQNIVRAATWLLFALAGTAGIFFLLGADFIGATQLLIYVGGTLVLVVFGVMLTAQGPFINLRIDAAEWAISIAAGLLLYGTLAICLFDVQPPPSYQAVRRISEKEAPVDVIDGLKAEHPGATIDTIEEVSKNEKVVAYDFRIQVDQKKQEVKLDPQGKPLEEKMESLLPSRYLGAALLGDRKATPRANLTGLPANIKRERSKVSYLLPFEIVSVHLLVVLIGAAYLARAKRRRGVA